MLLNVHSSFAIILMGKRELVALLSLSSWCLMRVVLSCMALPRGAWACLRFVIVVFPDLTHLLFFVGIHLYQLPLILTALLHVA